MGSYDAERGISEAQGAGDAVATQMGSIAEQVKEKASEVAERAGGALASAQERGSDAAGDAGEVLGALREAIVKSAREQPGTTVLLSIAAGFALGAMWRSGRQ